MCRPIDKNIIIVMYKHGASGRFMSGLIQSTISNKFDELLISADGHFLSSGIMIDIGIDNKPNTIWDNESLQSNVRTESLIAELEICAKDHRIVDTSAIVVPSHNYNTVPVYLSAIPKLTILDIICTSDDAIVCYMNSVFKVTLGEISNDSNPGIKQFNDTRKTMCLNYLISQINENNVDRLTQLLNSNSIEAETLIVWATHVCENGFWTNADNTKQASHYQSATNIIEMPFSYIRNNNITGILNCIQNLLTYKLSAEQEDFIIKNLNIYHSKQNKELLKDTKTFIDNLNKKALLILESYK